jgi:hypothetical protein
MKKQSSVTTLFATCIILTPLIASAETFRDFIADIVGLINVTIPVLIGAALVFYFWNVVTKIINKDSKEAKEKLRDIVPMGLLALFVLVSIWGILNILQSTFLSGS